MPDMTEESQYDRPSKSQVKREHMELQSQIQRLLELNPAQRAQVEGSELFLRELQLAAQMKPSSARNRQVRRLGKILASDEELVTSIATCLLKNDETASYQRDLQHSAEYWRERILTGDDSDLQALLELSPELDRQKMRQLTRDYRKDQPQERKIRIYRETYRAIFISLREIER